MRSPLRILAVLAGIAHLGAIAGPCGTFSASPSAEHAHHSTAHAGSDESAHCSEHAAPPVEAKPVCPCGCSDDSGPGQASSRVGFALLSAPLPSPAYVPPRDAAGVDARLPLAPPGRLDPVPI